MSTTSEHRPYLPGTTLEVLQGETVSIRPFTYDDVERRAQWPRYAEPEYSHLNVDLFSESRRQMWYRERRNQREPFWFAIDAPDGKMIGEETLREVNKRGRSARLGIHMSPAYLGQGYGTEAVRVLARYLFEHLHFGEMKLDVAAHNRRAIRSYEKLGFGVVGSFWRMHPWAFQVLKDPRCIHLRPYVRMQDGIEVMKHWEMSLMAGSFGRETPVRKGGAETRQSEC